MNSKKLLISFFIIPNILFFTNIILFYFIHNKLVSKYQSIINAKTSDEYNIILLILTTLLFSFFSIITNLLTSIFIFIKLLHEKYQFKIFKIKFLNKFLILKWYKFIILFLFSISSLLFFTIKLFDIFFYCKYYIDISILFQLFLDTNLYHQFINIITFIINLYTCNTYSVLKYYKKIE